MRTIHLTTILIFSISSIFSQEKKDIKFNFTPENSIQVSKEIYAPSVYKISEKKINFFKFDTIKVKTEKYIEYENLIEKFINDSIRQRFASRSLKFYREEIKKIQQFKDKFVENGEIELDGYIKGDEIDYKTLSGNYIKIDSLLHKVIYKGNLFEEVYVKSNKAKNLNIVSNKLDVAGVFILQNENTKELYLCDTYFTGNFSTNTEVSDKLNKNGFTTKKIGRDYYIILPNKKIKVDNIISDKVKTNNFKFIKDLSLSIDKYSSLSNQAKPLIEKLSNHINAYQSKTLTKERLSQWKIDNLKGQALVKQFSDLLNAQEDIYYLDAQLVGVENSKACTNISNAVLVSNKFIGM